MSGQTSLEHPGFFDFILEVGRGSGTTYPLRISSPAGNLQTEMVFPFAAQELEILLLRIETMLLRSGQTRRVLPSSHQEAAQEFGSALFEGVMPDDVQGLYYQSRREAEREGKGLRLKMRIDAPELASLPWEFLYDSRTARFVGLSAHTPIVRDLGVTQAVSPLRVEAPLRVLGMIANPRGLESLDVEHERKRVEEALAGLSAAGLVNLQWLEGETWRELQRVIRTEEFHIFHFIGHGGFDPEADEGLIALADDTGNPYYLPATELAMLLADEEALRLVVLNSCDGARGGTRDVFSSTASILVRRGVPTVLAMQYEITDKAAIEFSRVFYEALAEGTPIDAAVSEGRKAVRLAIPGSLEWVTPMLYMRTPDGVLFNVHRSGSSPTTTESQGLSTALPVVAVPSSKNNTDRTSEPRPAGNDSENTPPISKWKVLQEFWSSIPDVAKAITGFLTAVTGLLTFLAANDIPPFNPADPTPTPNSAPTSAPSVMRGEVLDARVDLAMTLREACELRGWDCSDRPEQEMDVPGAIVNFGVRLQGYADRPCEVKWTLFNAETAKAIPTQQNQRGWPLGGVEAEVPDDEVRGEVWVPLPSWEGEFYVELSLRNDLEAELDTFRTDPFRN